MRYRQSNPIPVPHEGRREIVPTSSAAAFDWGYELENATLVDLYEKGKRSQWNASDLDWSIRVDIQDLIEQRIQAGTYEVFNQLLQPPHPLSPEEAVEMELNINAWMLSQFLHGEQGALLATAKIVQTAPLEEAKWYAANQVADEARHVEVYHRYLTEKLGRSFEINASLQELLREILTDRRWDMTYLGMQIMVEGLALSAFGMMKVLLPSEPLIQDITSRVMADEARHVAFGVLSLEHHYRDELDASELREREDFVIEATLLLRDRLLMGQVYTRMGWDEDVWLEWAKKAPFMVAFRQMLFSKIVPNLKRLGLLTPRVREEFSRLDLQRYEHGKDSTQETGILPPAELLELLAKLDRGTA